MFDTCEPVLATVVDLCEVSLLESSSFPSDEAASDETIRDRQRNAGKYFVVMKGRNSSEVIGFVNGTCIEGETITHESMTDHNPDGRTLVIHSVTVSSNHRRKGCGMHLLKKYVKYVTEFCPEVQLILLLSKAYLLRFYLSCGFQLVSLSPVHHGQVSGKFCSRLLESEMKFDETHNPNLGKLV
jgi:ribosomal protein S18 acetylase RimI-like enzyme